MFNYLVIITFKNTNLVGYKLAIVKVWELII